MPLTYRSVTKCFCQWATPQNGYSDTVVTGFPNLGDTQGLTMEITGVTIRFGHHLGLRRSNPLDHLTSYAMEDVQSGPPVN